ncbi:AMP-binding protein [Hydrogenophaga sp.]|uniref:AMP-binding protein n=1 Tax=Hydrogenophaga sp. TaxID=1904254 RepID=UPI003569745C
MAANDTTYTDLLVRNARLHGDRTAFQIASHAPTHREQLARTAQLAAGLRGLGVGPGDRVAILARNRIEFLDLLGAAAHLGAIVSAINWRLSTAEVALVLAGDTPKLVLVDDEFWPLLDDALARPDAPDPIRLDSPRDGFRHVSQLYLEVGCEPATVAADDPLLLIHTAWSDQRPKAATLTHRNLLANALQLQQAWTLGPQDVHLCCLPLFHSTAVSLTLATQMAGGSSVLMPAYQAGEALALIGLHRVSLLAEFAPMLGGLLDAAASAPAMLASLRHVCGLDAPETIQRLEATCTGATFWTGYGQTEASGLVSLAPWRDLPGSVGLPLPLCAVDIVDEQGLPLPTGETGEIALRGPCVFAGYWQRPADNAQVFRSGRLHTGDSGHLDAQGVLWYSGRLATKELIKTGGENVYPDEVETVLRLHPQVVDVAVIGVVDAHWGESVRAICVAAEGARPSEQELIDFVGERIARYKRPRVVVFAATLPKKADGSNDRERIKQLYA